MTPELSEVELQRRYYAQTADRYDQMHVADKDEQAFALSMLVGLLDFLEINSVLDIGAGTGRVNMFLKQHRPGMRVLGVEPVQALREIGHRHGVPESELVDGDATALSFKNGEFDLVCEFAVLHHIRQPERVVAEMLRVARKAIFISDGNNFGQGSPLTRIIKQCIHAVGLWKVADYLKTGGKGYTISDGDGLAYSYSVFDNYRQVRQACKTVHVMNLSDAGVNPYRTASQATILGIK